MALLYITEFADIGRTGMYGPEPLQVTAQPAKTTQIIAIGSSSVSSAAFAQGTQIVRLHSDVICSVLFAASPTVTTATGARMVAGQTEYFSVPLNASSKLAVINNV